MNNELTADERLHGKWFLSLKKTDGLDVLNPDLSDMRRIDAPPGRFYADPFPFEVNGTKFVFFEQFDYVKGWLSYFVLDGQLSPSGPFDIQIDITAHTSFPYMFWHEGRVYMVPETCHMDKIRLYEADVFPRSWVHKADILAGIHAADPQIIHRDGKFWLFTMIYVDGREHFCIYHSNSLFGGWVPHKLVNRNNIKPNDKVKRGAGKIFENNGRLVRPAQFSDRGINGEGVVLYEIIKLTVDEYEEVPLTIVMGPQLDCRAVHTFSADAGILVMDGREIRDTDEPYSDLNVDAVMGAMDSWEYLSETKPVL